MSLPSAVQGMIEGRYEEACEYLYTYVEDELEKFISEAINFAVYESGFDQLEMDTDLFRNDVIDCLKSYIKASEGKYHV